LVTDAVFFSARMLFTLSTLNSLENGNWCKMLEQKRFFHKNGVQTVASDDRYHTEIGLGQRDIRRSCSSNRWNL